MALSTNQTNGSEIPIFCVPLRLIEMIVVLAIIAILMSMAYPTVHEYVRARQSNKGHEQPASDRNRDTDLYLNDNDGMLFSPASTVDIAIGAESKIPFHVASLPIARSINVPPRNWATQHTPISYGVNAKYLSGRCRNVRYEDNQAYSFHPICTGQTTRQR